MAPPLPFAISTPLTIRSWLTLLTSFVILMVAFSFGLFSLPEFYPSLVRSFHSDRASVNAGGWCWARDTRRSPFLPNSILIGLWFSRNRG